MQATLELPITLERLTPEEITWLAAKSSQDGVSTSEVVKDLISKEAARNRRATDARSRLRPVPPQAPQGVTPQPEGGEA